MFQIKNAVWGEYLDGSGRVLCCIRATLLALCILFALIYAVFGPCWV